MSTIIDAEETADVHVARYTPVPSPARLAADLPVGPALTDFVAASRDQVRAVLSGEDPRLLVVVGPCSIHDPDAGLRLARAFLRDVNELGLPCATEFLEPISPQYIADLVTFGAIGARTTESQIHRQLASGLSMPVGFKNGTDGAVQAALDAMVAATTPQSFLGIDGGGSVSLVTTTGNPDSSLILRGGANGPNFGRECVADAARRLAEAGLSARVVVDASHANSGKDHVRQAQVAAALADQIRDADSPIAGVMLESNLVAGAQRLDIAKGATGLTRGQSVTDACMGWDATQDALAQLAEAVTTAGRRGPTLGA